MDYKDLYEKWQEDKYFVIDGDRLKEKSYVFSSFPTSNLYGFQNGKIRSVVAGDLLARFERLKNKNVLFPIGFNTLSQSSFIESRKSSNALNDDISNIFYNQMLRLGIGINQNKVIDLRKNGYISNLQLNFIDLYEKGYIKYHNRIVYQDEKTNKIYDFKNNSNMTKKSVKVFELNVKEILPNIINTINSLDIENDIKRELISFFKPVDLLKLSLSCNNSSKIDIEMINPEYLGGVSYIFLNPEYIDIKKYVSYDEYDGIMEYIENPNNLFAYSGINAFNPLTGHNIPIFISNLYNVGVYLGIPSINDEDMALAETEGLEYTEILDNGILINSDFLDGMDVLSARKAIFDAFINAEIASSDRGFLHTEILIHQLDKFGALFPFLEYKNNIESLRDYLPFNFSNQFRPILSPDVNIPGSPIDGTMASNISTGFTPLISITYDELGFVESMLSKGNYFEFSNYFPIDTLIVDRDNIINELLMPIIIYNFIKNEFDDLAQFTNRVIIVNKTIDVKLNDIKRSNNNLIDFDDILDKHNPDAIRLFSLANKLDENLVFNEYIIDDYDLLLKKIKNRIIKCDYSNEDNVIFKELAEKVNDLLSNAKIFEYVNEIINFSDYILNNDFSKDDILIYLKIVHPIFPFLSEELYQELFGGRFSIVNDGYPI